MINTMDKDNESRDIPITPIDVNSPGIQELIKFLEGLNQMKQAALQAWFDAYQQEQPTKPARQTLFDE